MLLITFFDLLYGCTLINHDKNFAIDSTDTNLKIMVQACIHPGEADGKDAMLVLLRDVFIKEINPELFKNLTTIFIPIFNVDGHNRNSIYSRINQNGPTDQGWRTTAQNINLNRDYVKADAPEMKAWLKLYNKALPELYIDLHTTDVADYQYTITYDFNVEAPMLPELKNWIKDDCLSKLEDRMEKDTLPIFPYVYFRKWHDPKSGLKTWFTRPMLSTGYATSKNRVGFLVETHMLKTYKQRVDATQVLLIHTFQIINKERANLKLIIAKADQASSETKAGTNYPIDYRVSDKDSILIDFLGKAYTSEKSDLTGGDWFQYSNIDTTFKLAYFNKLDTVSLANIPAAYIVPAQHFDIIEIVKLHGIKFTTLKKDDTLNVKTYFFTDYEWAKSPFEGRFRLEKFETEEINVEMFFPKGSIIINTNQPSFALIMHMFEPKSPDSFLQWGFFNFIFEQKEYAESYVMEAKAREMLEQNPELKQRFEEKKANEPVFANHQYLGYPRKVGQLSDTFKSV